MTEQFIPAVFLRGGSSKGVFFKESDLPASRAERDRIFCTVLGSPDPYARQLNGMGGGVSSLSKAVIIGPPTHPDADVDYTFIQVAVDKPVADYGANCGNLSSAVGMFAVNEGFVTATNGEALVRIYNTNTRKIIHARFPVSGGRAEVSGDFAIGGVAGTGARVRLDFLDPGGTVTSGLLPTGNVVDRTNVEGIGELEMSLVDASNPVAFVRATDLGFTGSELPDALESTSGLLAKLDTIRRAAGVLMGLGETPEKVGLSNPKIAMVSKPGSFIAIDGQEFGPETHEIGIRIVSMERIHKAVTMTGAMCTGIACRIDGTIAAALAATPTRADEIRVGNPSGYISVNADVSRAGGRWAAKSAIVYRTARYLMKGAVAVPGV